MDTQRARVVALDYIEEPELEFAHARISEDPKGGLFSYGPIDSESFNRPIRVGVVGTRNGLNTARRWMKRLSGHILSTRSDTAQYLPFPGFEAAYGISWDSEPCAELEVKESELIRSIHIKDKYQRVHSTVTLYERTIKKYLLEEEGIIDVWLVVIPDDLYTNCRPQSSVSGEDVTPSTLKITKKMSRRFLGPQQALFKEDVQEASIYRFQPDFHNQLKARLLSDRAIVQIAKESTLDELPLDQPRRRQDDAMVAWNMATALYYKAGGRPWQLAHVRDGVCYVGLVFKKDETETSKRNVCCGAQLFMSNGDGVVFKVAKGNFESKHKHQFHLSRSAASKLIKLAVSSYEQTQKSGPPKEIFVHGRTRFNQDELEGFRSACPDESKLSCVRIGSANRFKLFTQRELPVLRGTAYVESSRNGFLWTRGFVPEIGTYPGREVPNPLNVELVSGETPMKVILSDLLALTKVNFNSCMFADGLPVTIRFANAVGEILTSAPIPDGQPLPFRHYI